MYGSSLRRTRVMAFAAKPTRMRTWRRPQCSYNAWPATEPEGSAAFLRRFVLTQCGVGAALGRKRRLEAAEVIGDRGDVFILDLRRHARHDRILAAALLVFLDGTCEVVRMLPGERWILAGDANPILSVAGRTQLRGLGHRALRLAGSHQRLAREVADDIRDILIGEARRLGMHREMRTVTIAVLVQGSRQILGMLPL